MDTELDAEHIYRAILALAFRDREVSGEEMDWLRRSAELLDLSEADRQRVQSDVRYQSRMGQLAGNDHPPDIFRRCCLKAWRSRDLGVEEVEALEDLARAFGMDRAEAERTLATTAPPGAKVPDLVHIEGEGRPGSPTHGAVAPGAGSGPEAAAAVQEEGSSFPVVEVVVVLATLGGVAMYIFL